MTLGFFSIFITHSYTYLGVFINKFLWFVPKLELLLSWLFSFYPNLHEVPINLQSSRYVSIYSPANVIKLFSIPTSHMSWCIIKIYTFQVMNEGGGYHICCRVIFNFLFCQMYFEVRWVFFFPFNWYVKVGHKSWKTVSSKLDVAQIIFYQSQAYLSSASCLVSFEMFRCWTKVLWMDVRHMLCRWVLSSPVHFEKVNPNVLSHLFLFTLMVNYVPRNTLFLLFEAKYYVSSNFFINLKINLFPQML